jgi:hypothetical protein
MKGSDYNRSMATEKKSGFHYFGIGCLIVGVVGVIAAIAVSFWIFQWSKEVKEKLKDPASREQQALEILGADRLPEGYYAMLGVRVPFLLETAILTDQRPDEGKEIPGLGDRGLLYFSMRSFGRDREDLDAFFRGETEDPAVLNKHNVQLDLDERVASGVIERATGPVNWVSHYGEMNSQQTHGHHQGLVTLLQVHCAGDNRNRLGVWFAPSPEQETVEDGEEATASLAGSIADPAEVEAFAGHFRFCPAN